ncbi:HET-domain-containing protein [Trematosphaeria pertusa]|uniref:HET-domain-containing protein n=1 Tax=Trematosphaeria pertusa TaxID=390896 RepID=A0A6A6J0A2_9PLEO|nr:HET-domain-containing protein [Trematosphaeria pertusa]KAF2256129.1 HET-domain-containing protein [Trematosphaeria pertusa]
MTTQKPYQYQQLDAEKEIRILLLDPAPHFADPLVGRLLRCSIRQTDDALPLSFEAVSYCWGSLGCSLLLECDGHDLPITKNVDSLLRHLRKAFKSRHLWIDALCINQGDVKEKEKQVRNMGIIFSLADKVHVWLGDAKEEDHIPMVFSILKEMVLAARDADALDTTLLEGLSTAPLDSTEENGILYNKTTLFASFLARPWFRRRWVIQEVALSHVVTIHCGRHKLSWNWVRESVDVLHAFFSKRNDILPLEAVHALENAVSLRPGTQSVLDLLFQCHSSQCVDNRDRLFSLYSIVSRDSRALLDPFLCCPVDYSNDWTWTYTVFAAAVVEVGSIYDLLAHAIAFGNLGQQDPAWPSWVPAWNKERLARNRFSATSLQDRQKYAPCVVSVGSRIGLRMKGLLRKIEFPEVLNQYPTSASQAQDTSITSQLTVMLAPICGGPQPVITELPPASYTWPGLLSNMLLVAIHDTLLFYRCTRIDFDRIFGNTRAVMTIADEKSPFELLRLALLYDLGYHTTTTSNLAYTRADLHHEVNKVLDGYQMFCIKVGDAVIPGIAPPEFEPGDVVFRPRGMSSTPHGFGFMLRPFLESALGDGRSTNLFRLVGACFLGNDWMIPLQQEYPEAPDSMWDEIFLV